MMAYANTDVTLLLLDVMVPIPFPLIYRKKKIHKLALLGQKHEVYNSSKIFNKFGFFFAFVVKAVYIFKYANL